MQMQHLLLERSDCPKKSVAISKPTKSKTKNAAKLPNNIWLVVTAGFVVTVLEISSVANKDCRIYSL